MELEKNGREHDQFNQEIFKIIINITNNNIISIMMYTTKIKSSSLSSYLQNHWHHEHHFHHHILHNRYELSSVILKPAIEDLHKLKRFD